MYICTYICLYTHISNVYIHTANIVIVTVVVMFIMSNDSNCDLTPEYSNNLY